MMSVGFIGTGNMGGALARAASKVLSGSALMLADHAVSKAEQLAAEIGGSVKTNAEIAAEADYIFIGVKPQMLNDLFEEIAPIFAKRTGRFVLVSMAAGTSVEKILRLSGREDIPVIRIMPNTPAMIGEGMILYAPQNVTEAEETEFLEFMAKAGRLAKIPERLIDAASSVSGCGPAYVYMFIEALADGGVACGLPRADAMQYAAQMVMGSAKLVLESGKHPGELKDQVCSPGGTTIQGVRALEDAGFRGAIMEAVIRSYEKNADLK